MLNMQETDAVFDGVAVRIYEPVNRSGVLPGMMYYHGGGFVFGTLGKQALGIFFTFHQLPAYLINDVVSNFDWLQNYELTRR